MPLTLNFWNEIRSASRTEKPAIVRKYGLTCAEIEKAGEILRKEQEGMTSFGAWRK